MMVIRRLPWAFLTCLVGCFGNAGNGDLAPSTAATFFVGPNNTGLANGSQTNPFLTITDALDVAVQGSVIRVLAGSYDENLPITVGIRLIGESAASTILQGDGSGSVLRFNDAIGAEVQGFTITGGFNFDGGAIFADDSTLTIRDCLINNNGTGDTGGNNELGTAGVLRLVQGTYLIERCVISNSNGNALGSNNIGQLTIRNTIITNTADQGITISGDQATQTPDIILENVVIHGAVNNGIFMGNFSDVTMTNVILASNAGRSLFEGLSAGDPLLFYNDFEDGYRDVDSGGNCTDADCINNLNPPDVNVGNIVADPLFVDEAGGDFHLMNMSPCAGTGSPDILNPDGLQSDMGAFGGPDGDWDDSFTTQISGFSLATSGSEPALRALLDEDNASATGHCSFDWNLDGFEDDLSWSWHGPLRLRCGTGREHDRGGTVPPNLDRVQRCTVFDVDGDLRLDLVIEDDAGVRWYRNRHQGLTVRIVGREGDEVETLAAGRTTAKVIITRRGQCYGSDVIVTLPRHTASRISVKRKGRVVNEWNTVLPASTYVAAKAVR